MAGKCLLLGRGLLCGIVCWVMTFAEAGAELQNAALEKAIPRLESMAAQLDAIQGDAARLAREGGWRGRGYFTAEESAHMEWLFFKLLNGRRHLQEVIEPWSGRHSQRDLPDADAQWTAHALALDGHFLLLEHTARFVTLFQQDAVAVAKLNEAFYLTQIPAGTFRKLALEVTEPRLPHRLEAAWTLLEQEARYFSEPRAKLARRLPGDYERAVAAVEAAQGRGFKSGVARVMSHAEATKLARKLGSLWGDLAYASRSLLFKSVSRIKSPRAKVIRFSDKQQAQIQSLLQPGDLVLTYTAGYVSDMFIPGRFKHGITYTGTPHQRATAGIDARRVPLLSKAERAQVQQWIEQPTTANGLPADMIEAVAEGVILNQLGHILDTHVNRLLVLRPRLSHQDRAAFVSHVFAYLDDAYDFRFDFADASMQVCTEVIYRALNGRGGIDFALTRRGGHPTLSADDIAQHHLDTAGRCFEVVLYAEEDFGRFGHPAKILTGAAAETRLTELMSGSGR